MAERAVVYRLRADITQFRAQMASAAASVKDAGDKMTATDKNGRQFRQGLDTLGGSAAKVGAVAAVGLGAALVKAANFDQAMSNVAAATHESAGNMDLLRAAALKAGASTVFSATEAADGAESLAKAGVSTADVLAGGLTGALNLAAAGGQSVGDAAESAATAMTQFGLKGKDVGHIADLLSAGAGRAQGSVADLSAALNQSGLVAAAMGLSIEDTTGTLASFASAGLIGSDAGTAFKAMIQRLQNPLGQGAKAMKELGINAYDAQGNFVGITDVAGQLQAKLGGLTQAQRDTAMAQIFGSDAVRAANVLYTQGAAGIQGWIDKTNDSGYAAETAATRMDNLKGDLEGLSGALETALIGTGDGSQGPLRSLVQNLTDVTNAYNRLPDGAKSATAATLGLTAAAGGGIFVFSKLIHGVASTREAMSQLGLTTGKAGTALSAVGKGATVAAAGLAGLAIVDTIQSGFGKAGPGIEAVTKSLLGLGTASELPKNLKEISDSIDRIANPNGAQSLQESIAGAIGFGGDSEFADARKQIEALDGALTGLVSSAGPAAAADALANLASSAGLSKSELADLKRILPGYKDAVAGAQNQTLLAAYAQGGLAGSSVQAAAALLKNTAAAEANAEAQKKAREAASETAQSFLGLGDSVNNAKVSLSGWIRQLSNQADALNNFTSNSLKAANRGLRAGLIDALQKAGTEGALRMKQLANATDKEIGSANRAWAKGQKAANRYTDTVTGGSAKATQSVGSLSAEIKRLKGKIVKIDENGAPGAKARIAALKRQIDALRDKTVTVRTIQFTEKRSGRTTGRGDMEGARGMLLLPGTRRFATGGLDPGDVANRHMPELAGPGLTRIWREPETQGEAYIPLANDDRRPRARAIAAETVSLLGGVAHFADGGINSRASSRGGDGINRHLKALKDALAKNTKAVDKQTSIRDAIAGKRQDLASSVKGSFTSDLFGDTGNVWAAGSAGGNPLGILKADIAKANAFKSTLYGLKKMGLDGDALAEIASTGDITKARALAAGGKVGVGQFESAFNQRAAVTSAVGVYAGTAAFGAQQAAANAQLAALNTTVKRLEQQLHHRHNENKKERRANADHIVTGTTKGINGAASKGHRDNKKGRG